MATTPSRPSPISASVDFERDGIQHGHLKLPYSRDDSAWGALMMPLTVIKRGEGPTALLTGGNHGDEYEGPIALFDLTRFSSWAKRSEPGRITFNRDKRPELVMLDMMLGTKVRVELRSPELRAS